MNICHIAQMPIGQRRGKLYSPLASIRLRALEVSPHLVDMGHAVKVVPFEGVVEAIRRNAFYDSDVYVVHKSTYDASPLLDELRRAGKRIVLDICDDVAGHALLSAYYPNLLRRADIVTVPSSALGASLGELTDAPVFHVPDCVELTRQPPALPEPVEPVRLLWFGRSGNLGPLLSEMPVLGKWAMHVPCVLEVVCDVAPALVPALEKLKGGLQVKATQWSIEALAEALSRCHFVILPSSGEAAMAVKSPNRLQEALWSGRLPIAHRIASYEPFSEAALLTDDLVAGIDWARANPGATLERIANGQRLIEQHFTPRVIAAEWERALSESAGMPAREGPPAAVRLNLGCGDKLLPGYVNVDAAEARGKARPDELCELHDLCFQADASVDEVLAVHVIERFGRWEAVDILREWSRVLKPGGRLVLESPNLKAACEALLRDPDAGAQADQRGQKTMWALYGDPSRQDPSATHRWGYTPASLGQLMAEAGLTDIREEGAQFRQRAPRDMRIVGRKPDDAPAAGRVSGIRTAPDAAHRYLRWFYDTNIWKTMNWRGVRTLKLPSDMWNYQEIISERGVQWIVETGTRHGGSALFFADLLASLRSGGKVVSVDVTHEALNPKVAESSHVHLLLGDSGAPETAATVARLLPDDRGPVFMILDSDHSAGHVYRELINLVPLLRSGDYLVVEDTIVNGHPVRPEHGPGPWEALDRYLSEHPDLLVPDVTRERKFGCTVAARGYFVKV